MKQPLIIDIKGNSLDDGPGIRTAIFFKGCPLDCIWCHNPESKKPEAELSFDAKACIGCGTCTEACQKDAIKRGGPDRGSCIGCFKCTEVCPSKAVSKVGREMSLREILEKVLPDKPFFDVSKGGVTLTGGEATLCMEWMGSLAKQIREAGIKVLLETCGLFDYAAAEKFLLPYLNDIYCDLKLFSREMHKKYCGAYNDTILENIRRLHGDRERFGYELLMRTPLVPGITDTEENLTEIAEFYLETGIEKTELLPYNPTWYSKNDKLGISLSPELAGITGWQSRERIEELKQIFLNRGILC